MYGSRFANQDLPVKSWREVYGVLVGTLDNENNVIVNTAIPIVAGTGAGVEYEAKHYVDTAAIDEKIYLKNLKLNKKEFFVGWWHTHPGFGFFFSETDTLTHLGYQEANPYAIGIIYDHTYRNSTEPGIEVLCLEDVDKNLMSPYTFVEFELEDKEEILSDIETKLKDILPRLQDFNFELMKFKKEIIKKRFAQLQRNYGLIPIKKRRREFKEDELLDDDEKYLYEWNEEYMKKAYRAPKFKIKLEKKIKEAEHQGLEKRKEIRAKIEKTLEKPKQILVDTKEKFYELKEKANIYKKYIDTDERKILENFESKLNIYIDSMNDLIQKAYNLAPD
ncbi:MAG: Mov34/MPN/PAD-1 family protein [Promethearchaeota archaeon]